LQDQTVIRYWQCPGLLNHLVGLLREVDVQIDPNDFSLLNTIKVPRAWDRSLKDCLNLNIRLREMASLPLLLMDYLKSKIKIIWSKLLNRCLIRERIHGGLALNIVEERKRVPLAVIGGISPIERDMEVTRSAEPNL